MCAYLSALHSQNCLRLFPLDLQGIYCMHFQTIELNEILQSLTTINFLPCIDLENLIVTII